MEPKRRNDPPGLQRLQSEVDKMFLELLRGERVPRYGKASFRPNADVYFDKRENVVVVKLELPGIDPDEVSLEVDDNILRVSGTRSDQRHPDAVYQQMEITYGRFERAVPLPPEVDVAKAKADYTGGYLEIVLPIRPRSVSKRIRITPKNEREGGQQR
ncbi:MAG: Hsp20/alpha crystallin family protein [bacterium]